MLRSIFSTTLVLLTASATLAPAGDKEDVVAAARKLSEAGNYSWTTTSEGGGGGGMGAGGASGKTQKDGLTMLMLDMRDTQARVIIQGDKAAVETPDDGWQKVSAADGGGRDRRDGPRDPNAAGAGAGGRQQVHGISRVYESGFRRAPIRRRPCGRPGGCARSRPRANRRCRHTSRASAPA